MKRIAEVAGRRPEWTQPSAMKRVFELWADGELVATLRFKSAFGTLALGESGDGCWSFKRVGFWHTRVTVRECGQDVEVATFHNDTWQRGGTLVFPDGRRFRATTNFWQTHYEFLNEADEVLVRYHIGGVFHMSATVEVLPAAAVLNEMPCMVLLGWYLAIMMYQDYSRSGMSEQGCSRCCARRSDFLLARPGFFFAPAGAGWASASRSTSVIMSSISLPRVSGTCAVRCCSAINSSSSPVTFASQVSASTASSKSARCQGPGPGAVR